MKNTVKINSVDLINADCLHFIQSLPDDSIDLIVTDPPYFKVKPNGWDNQWKGDEDYLKWLDHCLAQFWRVLKPAGSLYLFCGHRLASDIEIMMRERFNVLNHIIWAKPSGRWNGCNKESLRAYFPATERVLFAEHYQGPYRGKSDGYAAKERELKQHIMAPLISYFRDARAELGITAKQIAEATGKKNMVSHWFGSSQWQLPNEADYRKLQALFSRIAAEKFQEQQLEQPHHQLVASYDSLNRKYSELLDEFKSLRRYFSVSVSVPYTDVWMHKPVQFYAGDKNRQLTRYSDTRWHEDSVRNRWFSVMAGPSVRVNEWFSAYAMAGVAYSRVSTFSGDYLRVTDNKGKTHDVLTGSDDGRHSNTSLAWGAGVQFNPTESVAIDIAYEGSGSGDWRTDGFIMGVGYKF